MRASIRKYCRYILWIVLTAAGLIRNLPAHAADADAVFLPEEYQMQQDRRYPVLYLLADRPGEKTQPAFREEILRTVRSDEAMDMIVVCLTWNDEQGREQLFSEVAKIVEETDRTYRTVDDPAYRGIAGVGEGGCLAGMLAWTDARGELLSAPSLFGMTASIAGVYTGGIADRYGCFAQILRKGGLSNAKAQQFYTFMRTASESLSAYETDGANEVISTLIEMGAAYGGMYYQYYGNAGRTVLDLQIKRGEEDDIFFSQAGHDLVTGMSGKMMQSLLTGNLSLTPRVISAGTEYVEAAAQLELSPACELFGIQADSFAEQIPISYAIAAADKEQTQEQILWQGSCGETAALDAGQLAGSETQVSLMGSFLGMRVRLSDKSIVRKKEGGETPEESFVDLTGEWYFRPSVYARKGELPQPEEYTAWEQVIPCLGWWDEDFSEETNMKAYAGYGWYVKEFDLPAEYEGRAATWLLPLGCLDETDLCFVNGELAGYTGFEPESWTPRHDSWDLERLYEVDENLLRFGEKNVITVLINNNSGDGGWYSGHPGIYTPPAYDAAGFKSNGNFERYEDVTLDDKTHFLVCLPPDYDTKGNENKRYPVIYLLHQLNSSSRSYVLDGIDVLLDQAVAEGKLDDVIVVIPDSTPQSWWINGWEKVIAEEVVSCVDARYRTLDDREHRTLAGASMGGHGAYHIALKYPDIFSGIISFYGAINMASNPLAQMEKMDAESLSRFRHYFICGNRDLYKFGIPAIALDRLLREKGVSHFFELGEGEHDSAFYLPHLAEAFAYMEKTSQ